MAKSNSATTIGLTDVSVVKALLTRPIAFHPVLARLCGSVTAGLMLSQAIYWSDRTSDKDGWFYKTQAEWDAEITMSRTEQESARKRLRKFDFWTEKKRGVPALLYFRIDFERLAVALSQFAGKPQTRMQESSITGCGNPTSQDAGKPQTLYGTEITSETTTVNLSTSQKQEVEDPKKSMKDGIRTFIQKVQLDKTGITSNWSGREGKVLEKSVADNPSWTAADWRRMLKNWANSDPGLVRHGDRAGLWLPNISRFATGPIVSFSAQKAISTPPSAPWGTNVKDWMAEQAKEDSGS